MNCFGTAQAIKLVHIPETYFMTIMPFLVAASTSTLSTPVPALPMILRLSAALIISAVTLVADLTTRPS